MKITVIGSHLCPDTLYALCRLREKNAEMDYRNLSASLPDLKAYLAVRESCGLYDKVRQAGGIGIPKFYTQRRSLLLQKPWQAAVKAFAKDLEGRG